MKKNGVIIGIFVKKIKILTFLEFLKNKLKINIDKVFIFNVNENNAEYLVTFSAPRNNPYYSRLHDATILHTKNGCLFSINALNKYIDRNTTSKTKIIHKDIDVDWGKLKDNLLITTNGKLKILKISKIEDKSKLLSN